MSDPVLYLASTRLRPRDLCYSLRMAEVTTLVDLRPQRRGLAALARTACAFGIRYARPLVLADDVRAALPLIARAPRACLAAPDLTAPAVRALLALVEAQDGRPAGPLPAVLEGQLPLVAAPSFAYDFICEAERGSQ